MSFSVTLLCGKHLRWQLPLWCNITDNFLLAFRCEMYMPLGSDSGRMKVSFSKYPCNFQLVRDEVLPQPIVQNRSLIHFNVSEIAQVALWREHGTATPLFKLCMSIISPWVLLWNKSYNHKVCVVASVYLCSNLEIASLCSTHLKHPRALGWTWRTQA